MVHLGAKSDAPEHAWPAVPTTHSATCGAVSPSQGAFPPQTRGATGSTASRRTNSQVRCRDRALIGPLLGGPDYDSRWTTQKGADQPAASQIVRDALREDILQPLAERLGGDSPELRASSLMGVWMGMAIMRTVISIEPLSEAACDIDHRLQWLFKAALTATAPAG